MIRTVMLCQQCQAREATVHFLAIAWPSGEDTRHLCESYYPKAEEERIAAYSPKGKPLPTIDVSRITASEYLDFAAKAHANSADAPAYRHISDELKRLPATRERLGTEMLTMALQSLENGNDVWNLVMSGGCFGNSVPGMKDQAFQELLERIILRSVELMAESVDGPSPHPFGFGLTMAGNTLNRADSQRFSVLIENIKTQHKDSPRARAVLDYLNEQMAESEQRLRRKRDGDA
jgi:hypothetical protein